MEVNQTSPPPAPPTLITDGEDTCRIEVTEMAIDVLTLFICLCGLVEMGLVSLWPPLGFPPSAGTPGHPLTSAYLAFADFTFLHLMVHPQPFPLPHYRMSLASLWCPLMYLRSFLLLSLFSYNRGLYLLTGQYSIERCVSIPLPTLVPASHRPPVACRAMVCALLWVLSITVIAAITSLCLFYEHEHCQVALILHVTSSNFFIFTPSMVISSTVLFSKVQCGSQQRQPKRLYIVIFLTVLFFLIFGVPLSAWNFLQQFSYTLLPSQVFFLLACINSSIKPLIYFLGGSCRRHRSSVSLQVAFQRLFVEL
ncbi:LOW QUALITY PROTEIN: mas-related G-protein coupled receptor member H-like [Pluvialis apricaria]